jgi:hypothetical protein
MSAVPTAPADQIRTALTQTAERCRTVERVAAELVILAETLEHELVALSAEAGKLNAALAPNRLAGGGA